MEPFAFSFLLIASITYALTIFWYDWQHTKITGYSLGIQARYFFPTIVAHMSILITGIVSLGWDKGSRSWLRLGLLALILWLQLGGIWRVISIYYPAQSLGELITMMSQYKPSFAKGNWWYLWSAIYIASISWQLVSVLASPRSKTKQLS